jgi:hypothetical protein
MTRSTDRTIAMTVNLLLSLMLALSALMPVQAQEPPTALIGIYHIAPGKHLDFLRWQAAREAVATEAGIPATQWYAHTDGDSWDYISIGPDTTREQDDKADAIMKRKGLTTGFKASLEFRTMVSSHTDTFVRGPTTAAALVEAGTK